MRHSREHGSPEDAYLSYKDVCLTVEDINCLKTDDWLTDNNIAFYEEYLEHVELAQHENARIILLRPSISYLIACTQDLSTITSALPPLKEASHIFIPINDNPNPEVAEGGTHWSLLVVGVVDKVAFHYDSLQDTNDPQARDMTRRLEVLLGSKLRFMWLPDTPQQENTTDCGVHVCMNMQYLLLRRLLRASPHQAVEMSMAGKRQDASHGRKDMLKIIEKLRSTAIRSGSPGGRKENSPPRIA